jgi:hypothetical protein
LRSGLMMAGASAMMLIVMSLVFGFNLGHEPSCFRNHRIVARQECITDEPSVKTTIHDAQFIAGLGSTSC